MRAVILLAGMGRRISASYGGMHKALIPLNGKPLIFYILDNIKKAGISDLVVVLGYQADEVETTIFKYGECFHLQVCRNDHFANTNNLASLLAAKDQLLNQDFVVINGDMVFDYHILKRVCQTTNSCIAVDLNCYEKELDSPRVLIQDERIIDLGRHMRIREANGYAVGIYRFTANLTQSYFTLGEEVLQENSQAGFHDPLRQLFSSHTICPCDTEQYAWMDVDEVEDVKKAESLLNKMKEGYSFE